MRTDNAADLVLDLGGGSGGAFTLAGVVGPAGACALLPPARAERRAEVRTA